MHAGAVWYRMHALACHGWQLLEGQPAGRARHLALNPLAPHPSLTPGAPCVQDVKSLLVEMRASGELAELAEEGVLLAPQGSKAAVGHKPAPQKAASKDGTTAVRSSKGGAAAESSKGPDVAGGKGSNGAALMSEGSPAALGRQALPLGPPRGEEVVGRGIRVYWAADDEW